MESQRLTVNDLMAGDSHEAQTFHVLPDAATIIKAAGYAMVADAKETNPKDAIGIRKMAFSVLPWQVLCRVALAMLEGALKYGRHNYRAAGVRASVYFDAVVGRHLTDWWEGTDIDPDSNLHHLDKAIAGLMVMRDSMLQGNFVDDRPPKASSLNMAEFNRMAAELHDRYADKKPRHYTISDTKEQT